MGSEKSILILGIGNFLFKDGGVGIHVARRMMGMELPPSVEVIDGGLRATAFLHTTEGRKKVIVITAMKSGGPPGAIYRISDRDIEEKRRGYEQTIEETEFIEDLKIARMIGKNPDEVIFIGVEPEDTGEVSLHLEIGLSPVIEKKIPEIIEMVMKEVRD